MKKQIRRWPEKGQEDGKRRYLGLLLATERGLTRTFTHFQGAFLGRRVQHRTPLEERYYANTAPEAGG